MKSLTRKVLAAAALCAVLTACQARANPDGQNAGQNGAPESAPAAVPAAEVVQAVQEATAQSQLPASISNDQLLAASGDDESAWTVEGCNPGLETTSLDDIGPCTMGDVDGDQTLILIGDSAAAMWHGAFDLIGKRNGWKVIALTKNNCGPAELTYYQWQLERDFTECDAWQEWRMSVIQQEQPGIVAMAGWYGGNLGPDRELTADVWREGLVKTATKLPENTEVVMLGNQPHPEETPTECAVYQSGNLTACALPAADVLVDQTGWSTAAQEVGGTFIDVTPWFCTDTCPAIVADRIVYAGKHHITIDYAHYLSGAIEESMAAALGS